MTAKGNVILRGLDAQEYKEMEKTPCPVCGKPLRAVKQYKIKPTFKWYCLNEECDHYSIQKSYVKIKQEIDPEWGK